MSLINAAKLDAIFKEKRVTQVGIQLYEQKAPGESAMRKIVRKTMLGPKGGEMSFKVGQIGHLHFMLPGGDYPRGMETRYDLGYIYLTESGAALEIDRLTKLALEAGQAAGSDINFGQQLADVIDTVAGDREVHFWGNGDGAVATTATGSTTTRVQFEVTPNGSTPGLHLGAEMVRPLTQYDLINPASPGTPVASNITFVEGGIVKDSATPYADLAVALGGAPAAGLRLVPAGSYGLGFKGMAYMNRYPRPTFWQGFYTPGRSELNGVYIDAGGREFSLALRRRLRDKMVLRYGETIDQDVFHWMHPAQETNWANAGYGYIRLSQPPDTLDLEIKSGRYRGSVFETFPKCDPDTIYIGKRSAYLYGYLQQPDWVKDDGLMMRLKRDTSGIGNNASAVSMVYGAIDQYGVTEPHCVHSITNLGVGAGAIYKDMRTNA